MNSLPNVPAKSRPYGGPSSDSPVTVGVPCPRPGGPAPSAALDPAPHAAAAATWEADDMLTEIYLGEYRSLVGLAVALLRDVPTAEEVVQESFIAMHSSWRRLRDRDKALTYLRCAVVNRSRSVLRHRTVVDRNAPKHVPDEPSAEAGAIRMLERSAVISALRGLPDRQREALVLRYYADLSEAQIAEAMGISKGAVKTHTSRGIAALKSVLGQDTISPAGNPPAVE
jgi:RNA polymerase sigma-70 factor (sigma-E family)